MRDRDDEGTVLLLTVGLAVVLLLLVAVVVDVSAVVLARRGLASAADGAAVAAAQQADREAILAGGALDERLPLDPAAVEDVVAAYGEQAAHDQAGLELTGSVEGTGTAVVDARRTVRLPFAGWLGVGQVDLHVEARAESPTGA